MMMDDACGTDIGNRLFRPEHNARLRVDLSVAAGIEQPSAAAAADAAAASSSGSLLAGIGHQEAAVEAEQVAQWTQVSSILAGPAGLKSIQGFTIAIITHAAGFSGARL